MNAFPLLAIPGCETLISLGQICYFIVLPLLLLIGLGYLLQKKLGLDMPTLTRVNFHFIMPGVIYTSVVSSDLKAAEVGQAALFAVCMLAILSALTYAVARIRKVPPDVCNCLLMTTIFENSGNYGLPLQDLAFRASGYNVLATSIQAIIMIVGNFTNFTLGILLAVGGRKNRHWKGDLAHIARFPPLYALAAALLTILIRAWLGADAKPVAAALLPFWRVCEYIGSAFVAVALSTLGAQLALISREPSRYPVRTSVLLRLLGAPAIGLVLIYALDFHGIPAQVLLIGTTAPTAVNVSLMCMEFDCHPEFAAKAVLYSTLLSPLTGALMIFLVQGGFWPRLACP